MKNIFFLIIVCLASLNAQTIYVDPGASMDIGPGADVCPGLSGNFHGTVTGSGTLCSAILPVELVSFQADCSAKAVTLKWKSATEINCSSYIVERKESGSWWEIIADIKAAGNSNAPRHYSYSDKNIKAGQYQYRLKILDNDGRFEYSPVVETAVQVPGEFALAQNYPNPFNPSTTIEYQLPVNAAVNLTVYSITGEKISELVNEVQPAGYYSVNFHPWTLSSGLYICRINAVSNSGKTYESTRKMLLMK